jgi:hypothetical protein
MTISQYRTVMKAIIIFLRIFALIARAQLNVLGNMNTSGSMNAIDYDISKLEEELN